MSSSVSKLILKCDLDQNKEGTFEPNKKVNKLTELPLLGNFIYLSSSLNTDVTIIFVFTKTITFQYGIKF